MGILSGLANLVIDVAVTPINVVVDVATGNEQERTKRGIEKMGDDIEDIFDGDLF